MTRDEKELKQIEIVQKEITKQKSNFYESMNIVFLIGTIALIALIYTSVKTYKDIELSKNGLEECPNFHSNNSTDTIWVKNCEETTKQYKSK